MKSAHRKDVHHLFAVLFLLTAIMVCTLPDKALALESLNFGANINIGSALRLKINKFLSTNYGTDYTSYEYYGADLNNDGILEYVLMEKETAKNVSFTTMHKYLVIAEQDKKITLLSEISSFNLMISSETTFGVKNLLAFNNKMNQYNYDIYVWSPQEKMYILNTDKI